GRKRIGEVEQQALGHRDASLREQRDHPFPVRVGPRPRAVAVADHTPRAPTPPKPLDRRGAVARRESEGRQRALAAGELRGRAVAHEKPFPLLEPPARGLQDRGVVRLAPRRMFDFAEAAAADRGLPRLSLHSESSRSSESLGITGSRGQQGPPLTAPPSARSQTCRIPIARAPVMSRFNESPTKTASAAAAPRASSAAWKILGSGFLQPTR